MPVIRAIIVDFGGVLIDIPSKTGRLEYLAGELNISTIALKRAVYGKNRIRWNRAKVGALSDAEHMAKIGKSLRLPAEKVNWIKKQLFEEVQVRTDFVDYLKTLKGSYQLAILSNAIPCLTGTWEKLGFLDWFDVAINSSEVGMAKPDSRIFQLTVQRLGVHPAECIFVDDQDNNIDAASNLGFHTVHYLDSKQAMDAIKSLLNS